MLRVNRTIAGIVCCIAIFSISDCHPPTASAAETTQWRAGVARTKITPAEAMWMAGYAARDRPADGTLTDLWAKALWLEDADGRQAILITLDLIGIDRDLSQSITSKLQARYQLQRSQIAICTSHTHSGPIVARNLRPMHYDLLSAHQQQQVRDYAESLEASVLQIVDEAATARRAVQLQQATGHCTFAVNRRNNPEGEVPGRRERGELVGPFDHRVPVLVVRDLTDDNKPLAVVFGYACHATVLSDYQWCGDYPGYAQLQIESALPGCTAMFWAGCGGDQNPIPRRETRLAKIYGDQLGEEVVRVAGGPLHDVSPNLSTQFTEIELDFDTLPTKDELRAQASGNDRYQASRARMLLGQWEQEGALQTSYPYPIATWKLGHDLSWVFLGGEVVVDYSLSIKARDANAWIAAYANDVMAYIPSKRVLQEGGYEGRDAMVYYGLPTSWADTVEQSIMAEVERQIAEARR